MGHYNSVRHEFLLICTRGSGTPEVTKLFDSVQVIERQEHSRKPEEFRTIIDTLYPTGQRIELFCRGKNPEGWKTWGNEAEGRKKGFEALKKGGFLLAQSRKTTQDEAIPIQARG